MQAVLRHLSLSILNASRSFGALVLTGPRRSGKTWLLRNLFPKARYLLFEDPDVVGRFRADPQGFLDDIETPVILDEVQNVPEIFNYVRTRIDRAPNRKGRWLLTGSQESSFMRNVGESMAGRAAILHLLPLALAESTKVGLLNGGYPEVLARPRQRSLWFASYVQTYIERDVRSISQVQDLAKFRRFLVLLATRHGHMLNKTELAAPLGMSVPGITNWIDILQATGLILLVQPYFENLGKRLVKTPKLYFIDSGLACHLLGIESDLQLQRSPFLGPVFEGFVASEIIKSQINAGKRKELYYFRDQQGLEVDFLAPVGKLGTTLIEAKATRTPITDMAKPMQLLRRAWASSTTPTPGGILVHRDSGNTIQSTALSPGVKAMGLSDFVASIQSAR
jgi:uncharacterized protein